MGMTEGSRFGVDYSDPKARLARDQETNALELVATLRACREEQGLSQAATADRMGRHQSVVSTLERLGSDPRWSSVRRYATSLGCLIEYRIVPVANSPLVDLALAEEPAELSDEEIVAVLREAEAQ